MIERISGIFFGIALPSGAVFGAYALRLAWTRGTASQQWPTTDGTILESQVDYDGDHHRAKIRYQYVVQAEVLTGEVITYRGINTDRVTAEEYAEKYPISMKVVVYYDPASPAISVLEPGVDKQAYLAGSVVILVLFCVGIGLLIFTLWRWQRNWSW